MGMPTSDTALEERMCSILNDYLKVGVIAKIADDVYIGGNTLDDLLINWRCILPALATCKFCLPASKTTIAPKSTVILAWVWYQCTLKTSPHRIATLELCEPPHTVQGLCTFLGTYKILGHAIPACTST